VTDLEAIAAIGAIATEAELPPVADAAARLAERISAGRFYVACVGQFKRGKSTVLNALVGDHVLPVGVTPVTSAVTILRHGTERGAAVFYTAGLQEAIPLDDVPLYVTEEHNHENARGVAAVEISLPVPLLAGGLCLVDTPGIGSTFAGNTEATRAFVPHIDAALVVLGADPPISGDELALAVEVLAAVPAAIFALNKADRLSPRDVEEARAFTERLVSDRIGRSIGPVLEVSATERIETGRPTRDWQRLEDRLVALTGAAADVLHRAARRGVARLVRRLGEELDERRGALLRPIADSEARIALLNRSVTDAGTMLAEMGILLAAEQRRLLGEFQERQRAFLEAEVASARRELDDVVNPLPAGRLRDRSQAFGQASALAHDRVERWLARIEPEADGLYRRATLRFTAIANGFLARLAESNDPSFSALPRSLDPDIGLRERRHFYETNLMHLTAPGFVNRIANLLLPRRARLARVRRDAGDYLERLLRTNSTRAVFDLEQRVEMSRKALGSELRFLLQQITSSAERALERARERERAGQEAVGRELRDIDALRERLNQVDVHATRD
jgi:hypothetical protein